MCINQNSKQKCGVLFLSYIVFSRYPYCLVLVQPRSHIQVVIRRCFRHAPHPVPRTRTAPSPKGTRSRAPTAEPRGARSPPPPSTYTCPTGSRSHAPTAAPRDARPAPHSRTFAHPTGSRSRATTSAPPVALSPPLPGEERLLLFREFCRSNFFASCPQNTHGDDLVDAGALACLSTQALRRLSTPPPSPDVQSLQPRRASHDSPREAPRDL